MAEPRKIDWKQWLFILGFVVSLAVVFIFAMRAFRHAPRPRIDEPIGPWMSLSYVAHSYHIPDYVLYGALGLKQSPFDRRPISAIARQQHRSIASIIKTLEVTIYYSRPPYPTPLPFPAGETPLPPPPDMTPDTRGPS